MRKLADRAGTTGSTINKLEKGQTQLNMDWVTRLAQALEVPPSDLIDTDAIPTKNYHDNDVEFYEGDLFEAGLTPTQSRYIVHSKALDQIGIFPNAILVCDAHVDEISNISSEDVVIAELREGKKYVTVLRQFLFPSILVSNSSTENPPIINMRNEDVALKGVAVSTHNQLRKQEKFSNQEKIIKLK